MEYLGLLLVLQDSWKGREYWDEIELWEVEKVEMAACVVGRARDCVRRSLTKAMLPLEELNFGVTVVFVHLVERRALVSIKVAQRWIES